MELSHPFPAQARIYGAVDNDLSRRSTRFALLSPDAIWDADLEDWRLEEINTNGLFQLGADEGLDVKTFHVDEGYTEAWLQIAGVDDFPNRHTYADALAASLDAFCDTEGCDDRDRAILERAAHQNAHASSGWYRAWPPVDCGDLCGAKPDLAEDPALNALFADDMTPTAKKHSKFLRQLDRAYFASSSATKAGDVRADRNAFPHFLNPER